MPQNKHEVVTATSTAPVVAQDGPTKTKERDFRFWAIIAALSVVSLLAALENTVVSTSLPFIAEHLRFGRNYVWVTNGFFLASAVVQPLFGQLANIFGRRWLAISIVTTFTVGSAICGAANTGTTLIVGRVIQGIGSGGINVISDIIVSDLVPLRERGNFIAIILAVYSIGTSLGPFIGGILVTSSSWRWVFLITVPFGAIATVLLGIFLHVESPGITVKGALSKIDFIGNIIIALSTVSLLLALSYAESPWPWSNWHILVPFILGMAGLLVLGLFETSSFCQFPVIPNMLFRSCTAAIVYTNTFINSMMLVWVMFFLPVYFEIVLGSSPARTGVQLLPIVLVAVPGAVIASIVLAKYGRYRLLHQLGFAVASLGVGLFVKLGDESSRAEWIIYQVVAGLGSSMLLNTLLPAFQAAHSEEQQAVATASWAFIRSFGNIWGVAIPAAIFNNRVHLLLHRVSDAGMRQSIAGGRAYELGYSLLKDVSNVQVKDELVGVYVEALRVVWGAGAGFGLLGFVLSLAEKDIPLRKELDTEYGLEARNNEALAS